MRARRAGTIVNLSSIGARISPAGSGYYSAVKAAIEALTLSYAKRSHPHGMYGRWGWRGIAAYLIGFGCMIPFMNDGTAFDGPVAEALNHADITFFVGLPIAAVSYYLFARNIDVARETEVARTEAAELEAAAEAGERLGETKSGDL